MAHVVDSARKKLTTLQDQILSNRQIGFNASKAETKNANLIESKHTSIANKEVQEGKKLTATQFMEKLRKLNKDLVLEPHPNRHQWWNADKACLYLVLANTKIFLMVCEGDWMPEWTIMDTRESRTPINKPEGWWKKVEIPGAEVKRGWRTVLIRLILKGLLNVTEVEKEFGVGNRYSWQVLVGKTKGQLPI